MATISPLVFYGLLHFHCCSVEASGIAGVPCVGSWKLVPYLLERHLQHNAKGR